jgi:MacB-like periplasmic core domain
VKAWLTLLDQCRMLVRTASWIVPRRARAEWRREWEAELAAFWRAAQGSGNRELKRLRQRCCGAFLDAAWHRCNQGDLRRAGRHWSQTPAFLLFLLSMALLLFVAASGNLPRMQAILLKPPYNDWQRIATISRTGVISSAEWVIPYSWVRVWRGREPFLEGVAAYSAKSRAAVVVAGRHRATIASVLVEDSLFQVFGVKLLLGRTPQPGDAQTCPNCVVLSPTVWRRYFASDPGIVRKKVTIDGQEAIVAGVLPERFWFPSSSVGVWRLADPATFSREGAGVVARLRPGVSERSAEWTLQRDIANATGETFSGTMLQVWPVQERIRQPLNSYFMALGISLPIMSMVIWAGRLNLRPQCAAGGAFRWWSFLAAKCFLLLSILLGVVVEWTPEPYIFPPESSTLLVESASLWVFSVGCVLVLWWAFADQQCRCRLCLRRLALPAHIGRSGCVLLNWAVTELACPDGHGLLYVSESDVSWLDPAQWMHLDESWESLFCEKSESEVLG